MAQGGQASSMNQLPPDIESLCQRDLLRIVRRMIKSGAHSEQIKEWFVTNIPYAMRLQGGASSPHTVGVRQATPNKSAQE